MSCRLQAEHLATHGADARHGMQQQYYGGKNYEATDPDSTGGCSSPGSSVDRCGTTGAAAGGTARQLLEVGNDLFMHIIATADMRYNTVENLDFDKRIRDQGLSRSPTSTAQHETESDLFYAELRFGVDFRYQKNLTFQLLFENQSVFDGNLIDDRANTSNPGGTERVWPRRLDGKPRLSGGTLLDALPL